MRWNGKQWALGAFLSIACSLLGLVRGSVERTLGTAETEFVFGGSAGDYCCGESPSCYVDGTLCGDYDQTQCQATPAPIIKLKKDTVNNNDCTVPVPGASCITGPPPAVNCRWKYNCYWEDDVQKCQQRLVGDIDGTAPSSCGSTCT